MNDFGEEGSEESMLIVYFAWGSKIPIRGFVIIPNTTVLERTTVMVLVIMIALPGKWVWPDLVN